MKFLRQIKSTVLAAFIAICLFGTVQAEQLTVFAAASLKEALDEVAEAFGESTGHRVTTSYAGSSALARQIELGAPADVFISASTDWMDRLEDAAAIRPETRFDLLGNRLVLIGAAGSDAVTLTPDLDLAELLQGGRLAMALTNAVPAGIYGKAALQSLGLWNAVEPLVAQTDNVRAAMALVALRAAPLGIVYATDARAEPRVTVKAVFPTETHAPITYPVALTTQARTPQATAFLDYLRRDAAHDIFRRYGFIVGAE